MMSNIIELIKHRITPMDSEHKDINITRTFNRDDYKSLDVIIELLYQGGKYRQMWEEIKTIRFNTSDGHYHYGGAFDNNMRIDDFQQFIRVLEQKYFQKEENENG